MSTFLTVFTILNLSDFDGDRDYESQRRSGKIITKLVLIKNFLKLLF